MKFTYGKGLRAIKATPFEYLIQLSLHLHTRYVILRYQMTSVEALPRFLRTEIQLKLIEE